MRSHLTPILGLFLCLFLVACGTKKESADTDTDTNTEMQEEPTILNALIVDGQNNHVMWPKISVMMKYYLEETGLFQVEIQRTAFTWKGDELLSEYPISLEMTGMALEEPKPDPNFKPDFSAFDVVISNFGWNAAPWPESTRKALEAFVSQGGGFVVVHAADNSFPEWVEFNKMIGLGGWGDRTEKDGPYVYYNDAGELIRDTTAGRGGSHGPQHEFQITVRDSEHPITKGMPEKWLHTKDELYDRLRGPAENMTILATAYSDAAEKKGTGRHEPMIFTIDYGKGRVFHTPMGHDDISVSGVGFITTFTRGVEWAATGKVTQSIPEDFPTADASSMRNFEDGE
jgi:type 1 glutamine amidotransferase